MTLELMQMICSLTWTYRCKFIIQQSWPQQGARNSYRYRNIIWNGGTYSGLTDVSGELRCEFWEDHSRILKKESSSSRISDSWGLQIRPSEPLILHLLLQPQDICDELLPCSHWKASLLFQWRTMNLPPPHSWTHTQAHTHTQLAASSPTTVNTVLPLTRLTELQSTHNDHQRVPGLLFNAREMLRDIFCRVPSTRWDLFLGNIAVVWVKCS